MNHADITTKVLAGHDAVKAVEALNPERDKTAIRFGKVDGAPTVLLHRGELWISVSFIGPDRDAEEKAEAYFRFIQNGGRPRDWKE